MRGPPVIDPAPPDANIRISVNMWPIVSVTISNELLSTDVDYLRLLLVLRGIERVERASPARQLRAAA